MSAAISGHVATAFRALHCRRDRVVSELVILFAQCQARLACTCLDRQAELGHRFDTLRDALALWVTQGRQLRDVVQARTGFALQVQAIGM